MIILINDHPGHSFVLELSKSLSKNGYTVLHAYCTSFTSPKGNFNISETDYPNLKILPISNDKKFNKYSLIQRWKQEKEYAEKLVNVIKGYNLPDIIIGGNAPLFVQHYLQRFSKKNNIPFIFWCQDIHSIAIKSFTKKKLGILGYPIYTFFEKLEKKIAKQSDSIIVISNDFVSYLNNWGILNNITYIPNWAPLNEITLLPQKNEWSQKNAHKDTFKVIYSGTLGIKHNPEIIFQAALKLRDNAAIEFIVISEGLGAEYLQKKISSHQLKNINVLPYQPFEDFSKVLATADILIAILESDANLFSVPSKVLSYMCANRTILLAVPFDNLSAKIILENNAGVCVLPTDYKGFNNAILSFCENEVIRNTYSRNARLYAENNFNMEGITQRFVGTINIAISK